MNNIDTSKNNIPIKKVKKEKAVISNIKKEREEFKKELVTDVELVFGLDNGSTRNNI